MKMAERFGLPVLTFIDTAGAYPGLDAEERGQAEAIARNLMEMAVLEVPIVVTITGEGGSGGALALGVGDRVLHPGVRHLLGDLARRVRRHPLEGPGPQGRRRRGDEAHGARPPAARAWSTRSSPSLPAAPTPIPAATCQRVGDVDRGRPARSRTPQPARTSSPAATTSSGPSGPSTRDSDLTSRRGVGGRAGAGGRRRISSGRGCRLGSPSLLARRGVTDAAGAGRFLKPSLDQLHDPFLLAGMEEAVERLLAARDRKEKVAIVGDYDVDGISATAQLLAVFARCGLDAVPILPHRLREGYGFQPVHVEQARELGCGLIVTADCGSSSAEAVDAALDAGIGVVVTDHHLPGCELPAGALHINPRQARCTYPFRDLAAAGLALKLALALAGRCGKEVDPTVLLRIACLGTIADLVPLHGENRVIAALGLAALGETRSLGLKALIQQSGMKPPFTAADVGFRIGPRLNAAGRLHEAERALELLMSRDAAPRRRAGPEAGRLEPRPAGGGDAGGGGGDGGGSPRARRCRRSWWSGAPTGTRGWWGSRPAAWPRSSIGRWCYCPSTGELATGSGRSVPGARAARFPLRLERPDGALRRPLAGRGADGGGGELGRAAAGMGGGGGRVAGGAARHALRVRAAPGAARDLGRAPGAARDAGAVRPGQPPAAGAHRAAPHRRRAARSSARATSRRGRAAATAPRSSWWAGAGRSALADLRGSFEVLACVEHDSYRGGPVLRLVDSRPA